MDLIKEGPPTRRHKKEIQFAMRGARGARGRVELNTEPPSALSSIAAFITCAKNRAIRYAVTNQRAR